MHIAVVTLFPEMFSSVCRHGVLGRALASGKMELSCWNPRDYADSPRYQVDDRPYGGGAGMVLAAPPLRQALQAARSRLGPLYSVYLSPQGKVLKQRRLRQVATWPGLLLLAGRYEGVDQRLLDLEVDEEWSVGDYVLSGGELPAMLVIDALCRLLPGVLGNEKSTEDESFSDALLEYPHYTRPMVYAGRRVPEVLLSGDHEAIRRWRLQQALGRTWQRRPELLDQYGPDQEERALLKEYIAAWQESQAGRESGLKEGQDP